MKMSQVCTILILALTASGSRAAITPFSKKGPGSADEIVSGHGLVRTIRLQEYLDNVAENQILEKKDSQGGERSDIFIIYKRNDDGSKELALQLFDLNRDGKIDLVKHYQKGKLIKEEKDTDYDGITDIVIEYDVGTGEVRKKSQSDGHTNIWTYFVRGEVYRKEVDRNFDGKPDMWVYYKKGKVYRTEVDQRFDGKKIVKIDAPLTPTEP